MPSLTLINPKLLYLAQPVDAIAQPDGGRAPRVGAVVRLLQPILQDVQPLAQLHDTGSGDGGRSIIVGFQRCTLANKMLGGPCQCVTRSTNAVTTA